jgi:hypothetical protein
MIRLMLSVHGGGDAFGPFFATLTLGKPMIDQLLHRAGYWRAAHKLDDALYEMTYHDYVVEYFESGKEDDKDFDVPSEQRARLKAIFEDEEYPTDGFSDATPELPEHGNTRVECEQLLVVGAVSHERPGMVDFHWTCYVKHTDVEIRTTELKEEDIRAMLDRLS